MSLIFFQIFSPAGNPKILIKPLICNVISEDGSIKKIFRPAAALKKSYSHSIEILKKLIFCFQFVFSSVFGGFKLNCGRRF